MGSCEVGGLDVRWVATRRSVVPDDVRWLPLACAWVFACGRVGRTKRKGFRRRLNTYCLTLLAPSPDSFSSRLSVVVPVSRAFSRASSCLRLKTRSTSCTSVVAPRRASTSTTSPLGPHSLHQQHSTPSQAPAATRPIKSQLALVDTPRPLLTKCRPRNDHQTSFTYEGNRVVCLITHDYPHHHPLLDIGHIFNAWYRTVQMPLQLHTSSHHATWPTTVPSTIASPTY